MSWQYRALFETIDDRLPYYFLTKGSKLIPVPCSKERYDNLIANGYETLVEGVEYSALKPEIIEALNAIVEKLGERMLLLFPLALSSIISYEAKREGSQLNKALKDGTEDKKEDKAEQEKGAENKETKRRRK